MNAPLISHKRLAHSVFAMLLLMFCGAAAGFAQEVPPRPTDYVSDIAHVLSPAAVKEIDGICARLDHGSADTQLAVVTIRTLNGAEINDYALKLANSWGVGRKGRGILILLAIGDHKWRIEIGKGLETTLPNSSVQVLGNRMTPRLKANDFDGAATLVVHELAQVVSANPHQ